MTTIAPLPRHRPARRPALERFTVDSIRRADAARVALCCGVAFLGWYPADAALDEVLSDLARAAADPSYFQSLPWPRCCCPAWDWLPGEDVAVWHAGRLLAVVSRAASGGLSVRRFDCRPGS
jgi:hypothetical protein